MKIVIVNYTGVPLFLEIENSPVKIGCNSKKIIKIQTSSADYTRFIAKYQGERIKMSGIINTLLESSQPNQVLVLRAIINGHVKAINCIEINDQGRYMYAETKEKFDKSVKFYNISLPLNNSFLSKAKQFLGISFNPGYCESKDGLLCDKFFGIPVFFWVIAIFLILCVVLVVIIAIGIKNKTYGSGGTSVIST